MPQDPPHQPARKGVAHDEGGEWTGDHACHEGERPAIAFVHVVVMPCRTPEQEGAGKCEEPTLATSNWGVRPPWADDGEAREDQQDREPDMHNPEDGTVGAPARSLPGWPRW